MVHRPKQAYKEKRRRKKERQFLSESGSKEGDDRRGGLQGFGRRVEECAVGEG